jgi:4'-phosphopantetheinyl transferase
MRSIYWLTGKSPDLPENDGWLSPSERIRIAELRIPKRRNDWELGRWTAKRAIAALLKGSAPPDSQIEIRAASDGAPEAFLENAPAGFSISISHSHSRSLCAIGPFPLSVGCDLEWIEPRESEFLKSFFTPEELSAVKERPAGDRPLACNLIWSAKESILKVLRQGLRRDTRSVRVQVDFQTRDEWNAWTGNCLESSRIFHGWWRTCDGFVFTMAAEQPSSYPVQL